MKKVSTYVLMGIEILGLYLIYSQRYMQYRAIIYLIMACVAIVYIFGDIVLHNTIINGIIDSYCSDNENFHFNKSDLEDIEEIVKEIENKKNE